MAFVAPTPLASRAFLTQTRFSSRSPIRAGNRVRLAKQPVCKMAYRSKNPKEWTENEWKQVLSPREFHVLRQKGTEPPSSGEYDKFYPTEGHFVCRGCSAPLYSAKAKFDSGCGWPAFDKCYKDAVAIEVDNSFGMRRVEILCNNCGGHLGHVFEGERMTETNERHCVNSLSVKYVEGTKDRPEEKVVGKK